MQYNININSKFASVVIFGFLFLAVGVVVYQTYKPFKIFVISTIFGNKEHLLECEELPFYALVEKTISKNSDLIERIKSIEGIFDFKSTEKECSITEGGIIYKKGDMVLEYENQKARKEVEKILGKDFVGIPYRGLLK